MVPNRDVKDILREYEGKLGGKISQTNKIGKGDYSQAYIKFKNEKSYNLNSPLNIFLEATPRIELG